jgi:hypothetical protein
VDVSEFVSGAASARSTTSAAGARAKLAALAKEILSACESGAPSARLVELLDKARAAAGDADEAGDADGADAGDGDIDDTDSGANASDDDSKSKA